MTGMSAWTIVARQRAQSFAPVATGRLARSITEDPAGPQEIEPLIFSSLFGTNVEYARAHELGSGIHALDPSERELILIEAGFWTGKSDKKALSFFWPNAPDDLPAQAEGPHAGKHVFRRVYHPGVPAANQGQGYLRRGAKDSADVGRRMVLEAVLAEWRRQGL